MKFFWNGQLVRTSKTDVYHWAVVWVHDDGKVYGRGSCCKNRAEAEDVMQRWKDQGGADARHVRVVPLEMKAEKGEDQPLSFDEFMALAKANYKKGGDAFVECWDQNTYEYWIREFGAFTKVSALQAFELSRGSMKRDEAERGR